MSDFLSFFPEVEQQYGLPTGYLERVAQVESRMDPNAQNPNSSAGGLFQFINSTARQYNLADRFDPRQATDAAARLARDNAATLRNVLGRDPTAGELYLAHQQGAGGAARLLRNPDAPAVNVLSGEAFRLNGGRPGMTASQFAQRWIGKIDGQSASPQVTATATARGPITTRPDTMTGGSAMNEQTAEKPAPATIGGLGGLGGFQPLAGGQFGEMLQMIGMSLLSSPGNAPLQNLPALAMATQQRRTAAEEREYNRRRQSTLDSANLESTRTSTEARRLEIQAAQRRMEQEAKDREIWNAIFGPSSTSPSSAAPPQASPNAPSSPAPTTPAPATPALVAPPAAGASGSPVATPPASPAVAQSSQPSITPASASASNPAAAVLERIDRALADPRVTPEMRKNLLDYRRALRPETAPTPDITNYEAYRRNEIAEGRQPKSFENFMINLRRDTGVGDNTETTERVKSTAAYLSEVAKASGQNAQRSADLNVLARIASVTPTGPGTDIRAMVDGIGRMIGASDGTLKTQADAINALVSRIAPTLRQPGSGAQSDAELRGFLASLPSIQTLAEGNQLILGTLQRAAAIDMERSNIAAEWQAGKINSGEARAKIAELDRRSIFASEQERELIQNIMGGRPQAGRPQPAGQNNNWRILGVE